MCKWKCPRLRVVKRLAHNYGYMLVHSANIKVQRIFIQLCPRNKNIVKKVAENVNKLQRIVLT